MGVGVGAAARTLLLARSPAAGIVSERFGMAKGQATLGARARAPAPAIDTLRDQTGRRFSLALAARPDRSRWRSSTPTATRNVRSRGANWPPPERSLPAAQRPVLVAVSVNPRRHPGQRAQARVRAWGLAARGPVALADGHPGPARPVWHAYHIYVGRPDDGDIPHTEALVPDRPPRLRALGLLYPFGQRFVTHDLGVLGRAKGQAGERD